MSTRSAIIKKVKDNLYKGIYCHWDGYEECVGADLKEHYTDSKKVTKLINLGHIEWLGKYLPTEAVKLAKENPGINIPKEDITKPFGENDQAITGSSWQAVARRIGHNDHVYVFDKVWKHYGEGEI